MKKITLLILILLPALLLSQTQTENYIKTTTYKVESTTVITNPTPLQADQNITYFDGLNRPVQQIAHQQSGSGKDIVTHIEYDAMGRQEKNYLPYVPSTAASLNYKTSALTDLGTFYNTAKYENTLNPYSQTQFENSPLNRILKQAAPGEDWKLGNGHEIRFDYQTNSNEDQVRRFGVSFVSGNKENPFLEDEGIYAPSQLYKTIIKDENWKTGQLDNPNDHTTVEFKDKQGRIILKRTFDRGKWHDTYYIYDDFGNLTFVLPPKAFTYHSIAQAYINQETFRTTSNGAIVSFFSDDAQEQYSEFTLNSFNEGGILNLDIFADNIAQGSTLNSGKISDLDFTPTLPDMNLGNIMQGSTIIGAAYIQNGSLYISSTGLGRFEGDFQFNLKVNLFDYQASYIPPSLDRTSFDNLIYQYRYDKQNRLIEKKLPGKEWEYIVYDKLDRPVLTQDANLRISNKWLFTKYDQFSRPVYTGEYVNTTQLTRIGVQGLADSYTVLSETKQGVNTISGTTVYYSNNAFPDSANINLFTINYYDDYNFDLNGGGSVTSYNITPITNVKGLSTGNKVRVLGTTNWITNLIYYDTKRRPIYSYSKNDYLGTTSTAKSQFDFEGKILETTSTHIKNSVTTTIVDSFTYDHTGRMIKQSQTINGTVTPEIIVANTYDELGQLSNKKVGGKTTLGLQNVDYTYNIRGWLKSINDPNNLNQDNDLFGFGLHYNTIIDLQHDTSYYNNKPLYNGNISSITWKTNNINAVLKQYNYAYDALNRFKSSQYLENNLPKLTFDESISYDHNGNITGLSRTMPLPNNSSSTYIDFLQYSHNSGNQLIKVVDANQNNPNAHEGFKDGTNNGDDYSYDANGNMILDNNKGITSITYNHLDLPKTITFNTGQTIDYKYDATGIKQRKIVSNGITTDYAGGFQYENNILKFFPHPEGYVEYNAGNFSYIYQYKDHLGNVRLSYKDISLTSDPSLHVLEENSYYPFGLKHKDNNVVNSTNPALKYKYNKKEFQDEMGLNMYDYGARSYDPALGRWMTIDPLAENSRRWTPYNYAYDNPVCFVDPDGRQAVYNWTGKNKGQYTDNGKVVDFNEALASYGINSNSSSSKDIVVTADDGTTLFTLDDGKKEITKMTAKELYKKGTQWFEPLADNYMPLKSISKGASSNKLRHFTKGQIESFSNIDRWMLSYRTGGSGDWKASKAGANGFLLVTIEGMPYWADAVGQIPFATNKSKDEKAKGWDNYTSTVTTVRTGQEFGDGSIFGGVSDFSNSYDNYMILRGALYGTENRDITKPITKEEAAKYGF